MIFKYSRTSTHSPSFLASPWQILARNLNKRRQLSFGCCLLRRFFTFPLLRSCRFLFVNVHSYCASSLKSCPGFFLLLLFFFVNFFYSGLPLFWQCVACAAPLCANFEASCQVLLFQKLYISSSFQKNPENCANYAAHYLTWKRIRKKGLQLPKWRASIRFRGNHGLILPFSSRIGQKMGLLLGGFEWN